MSSLAHVLPAFILALWWVHPVWVITKTTLSLPSAVQGTENKTESSWVRDLSPVFVMGKIGWAGVGSDMGEAPSKPPTEITPLPEPCHEDPIQAARNRSIRIKEIYLKCGFLWALYSESYTKHVRRRRLVYRCTTTEILL